MQIGVFDKTPDFPLTALCNLFLHGMNITVLLPYISLFASDPPVFAVLKAPQLYAQFMHIMHKLCINRPVRVGWQHENIYKLRLYLSGLAYIIE